MPPSVIIAIANGALSVLEEIVPAIQRAVDSGAITLEQQADLMSRIDALRDPAGPAFKGPEWEVKP